MAIASLGGPVSGLVSLEATASDNVGVVSVQFKLDGVSLGAADTTAPFTQQWNTTTASEGAHTLTAEARDAANNLGTTSLAVLVQNTPAVTSPHYAEFDGVDDYARVADAPALSFGNGTTDTPFTMEMWLRPDAVQARHQILTKSGEYRVAIIYGTLVVDLRDSSTQAMAEALSNGVNLSALIGGWHHLAVTYDGRGGTAAANGINVYIDGVAVGLWRFTDASYVAMENLSAPLEIGHESDQWNQYDGGLDDLRIWNVVRTPAKIQAAMGAELAGTETGLVAYWRFNAGTGTTVVDDSPANNVSTLSIGTLWMTGGPLTSEMMPGHSSRSTTTGSRPVACQPDSAAAIRALVEATMLEPDGERLKITLEGRLGRDAERGQRQQEVARYWRPLRPNNVGCGGGI